MGMQRLFLLLSILPVTAIRDIVMGEPTAESATNEVATSALERLELQDGAQRPAVSSGTSSQATESPMLVDPPADAASKQDCPGTSTGSLTTAPFDYTQNWQSVIIVQRILKGNITKFSPGMTETEEKRSLLIKICHLLKVRNQECSLRFWEALCANKHFQASMSDPIVFMRMWLGVFASFTTPKADILWLDFFRTMYKRDALDACTLRNIRSELNNLGVVIDKPRVSESQLIISVLKLIESGGHGLVLSYKDFMDGVPTAGYIVDILNTVRFASKEQGILLFGKETAVLYDECVDFWPSSSNHFMCVRPMDNGRIFICTKIRDGADINLLKNILIEELPGKITDLFINIGESSGSDLFWKCVNLLTENAKVVSPSLINLWLYCQPYVCTGLEANEIEVKLPCLKQLRTVHNTDPTCIFGGKAPSFSSKHETVFDGTSCKHEARSARTCFKCWYLFACNNITSVPPETPVPASGEGQLPEESS